MKNEPIFRGVATALITPLTETGIDFERFGSLIDWQIEEGINAIVIAGTTGEGSTLTDEEHREAIRFAVERAAGRVPIIAGTGSNDTAYAVSLTKYACEVGADAMLVVTPYYNKATQKGLIAMYNAIADASTKPVILYNVPSRTGVGIEPDTYAALAAHPNIAAIKEANSDISKIVKTAALVGDKLDMYSGYCYRSLLYIHSGTGRRNACTCLCTSLVCGTGVCRGITCTYFPAGYECILVGTYRNRCARSCQTDSLYRNFSRYCG